MFGEEYIRDLLMRLRSKDTEKDVLKVFRTTSAQNILITTNI